MIFQAANGLVKGVVQVIVDMHGHIFKLLIFICDSGDIGIMQERGMTCEDT